MARKPKKKPKRTPKARPARLEPIEQSKALVPLEPSLKAEEAREGPGRPTDYTTEIADLICEKLALGFTLEKICSLPNMPDRVTVWRWRKANTQFRNDYALAREAGMEALADETLDIADDKSQDVIMTPFGPAVNREHISRSKVRIDQRNFLMARLAPQVFGDRVKVEQTGANGGPIESKTTLDVSKLSLQALAELANARIKSD